VVEPILYTVEYIQFAYSTLFPTLTGINPEHLCLLIPLNIAVTCGMIKRTVVVDHPGKISFVFGSFQVEITMDIIAVPILLISSMKTFPTQRTVRAPVRQQFLTWFHACFTQAVESSTSATDKASSDPEVGPTDPLGTRGSHLAQLATVFHPGNLIFGRPISGLGRRDDFLSDTGLALPGHPRV
jgi:hypothetical protein